eukprot:scaffold316420_cov20-Tisochrysis_lutea.AAC.2
MSSYEAGPLSVFPFVSFGILHRTRGRCPPSERRSFGHASRARLRRGTCAPAPAAYGGPVPGRGRGGQAAWAPTVSTLLGQVHLKRKRNTKVCSNFVGPLQVVFGEQGNVYIYDGGAVGALDGACPPPCKLG